MIKYSIQKILAHPFPVNTVVRLSEIGLDKYSSQLSGEANKGVIEKLNDDDFIYQIKWVGGQVNLYTEKDVELYEEEEEAIEIFQKDSYIVFLKESDEPAFKRNYCFKQRENYDYLRPYLDCKGSETNGWNSIHVEDPETWRYATEDEIFAYEQLGKPYDVTTFPKENYFPEVREIKL